MPDSTPIQPPTSHRDGRFSSRRARAWPSPRWPATHVRIPTATRQSTLAFLLFFSIGLGIMWPAPIHPGSSLFGPAGADLTGDIFYWRAFAQSHMAPFLPGTIHAFNAPQGRPVQWALNVASLPSSLLLWLSSMAIGAIATYTYWAVFAFALSALAMFLFARWVTGSWQAGLVAGLAWGFQPFLFSSQNEPLGDVFVVVIFTWRMLVAIERPTVRTGVLAGLAWLLAATWMEYYLLIMGLVWAVLGLYALAIGAARREVGQTLRAQVAAGVPIAVGLGTILAAGIANHFAGSATRPESALVMDSARPAMYVLPDPSNPFTGGLDRAYIERRFNGAVVAYSNIYVGVSVLVLAAVGLWLLTRIIRREGLSTALGHRRVIVALPLTVLIPIAFLFSMPPHVDVAGVLVPMPMDAVFKVTQVFRATARFEILVMLGLCTLLALAVGELVPRVRPAPVRLLVLAAVAFVVTADLWARADVPITRVRIPTIYHVLARQPPGSYAEFPILAGDVYGAATKQGFYQGWAGRDTFDGFYPGESQEQEKLDLNDPLAAQTERTLAADGVRYMIVDARPQVPKPSPYPRPGQPLPGARLIARDSWGSLYRIVAKPALFSVALTNGFWSRESAGDQQWQWATQSPSTIVVDSRLEHPVKIRVGFTSVAFGPARTVEILDAGSHRVLDKGIVPPTGSRIQFTATIDRRGRFLLTSTPGPIPVKQLDPTSTDTRSLTVQAVYPISVTRIR